MRSEHWFAMASLYVAPSGAEGPRERSAVRFSLEIPRLTFGSLGMTNIGNAFPT